MAPARARQASRPSRELVASLQSQSARVLRDALAGSRRVGFVDWCNTPNVGDSAIFLGLVDQLRRERVRLSWISPWGAPTKNVRRRLGQHDTILMNGGNGVGDIWPEDQSDREAVIAECHDRRIVIGPQSILFQSESNLKRARHVFNAHPDLTLLCRDAPSAKLAARQFDVKVELCPDAAFLLGPQRRPRVGSTVDILWLTRTDHEAVPRSAPPEDVDGVTVCDWMSDGPGLGHDRARARVARVLSRAHEAVARDPRARRRLPVPALRPFYLWLARNRLQRGFRLLSSARVVVADRLHVHILCTLLGVPHVLLPSLDGKIRNCLDTWTADAGLAHWCEDPQDALRLARSLLATSSPRLR